MTRTALLFFFAVLVLSCKLGSTQSVPPDAGESAANRKILTEPIRLCGVTVFQEQPGPEVDFIGNEDWPVFLTISANGFPAVIYVGPGAKSAIGDGHFVRGKEAKFRVEILRPRESPLQREKCETKIVIPK